MPVIYIDILFLINFLLDSGLLLIAGRLSGKTPHPLRILSGGILGGIYACLGFFVNLPAICTIFIKFLASSIMIFTTFYPFSRKEFIRIILSFYLQTFLLGGTLSALFYFSGKPAVMSNNIYYFPFSTFELILSALPLITALSFYWKKSKNRLLSHDKYCTVTISHLGKTFTLEGLIDSGNSLFDPISSLPAIIIPVSLCEKLFDPETFSIIKSGNLTDLLLKGFRILPYSTVSDNSGNMSGFIPDDCKINLNPVSCVIAFSPAYEGKTAIINPNALEE